MKEWLKSLALAAFAGAVIAAAPLASSMAPDGFTPNEWNAIGSQAIAGAFGGLAGLFVKTPRDKDKS